MFTEGGFGKRVTQAQFGDMYGVVHKALMAYPVFIGREADIVNYGIRTMDEGKTFPDPSSTAEPLGVGGRFAAEKVVTRGIARMIKEEALPLNPAQVARWLSSKTYGPNVLGADNNNFQARLKGMWGNLDKFVQATIETELQFTVLVPLYLFVMHGMSDPQLAEATGRQKVLRGLRYWCG